ncbi:FtsX-like permease family protein [Streptomyces sp. YIM 130001]|uniref:FtsX-like permease family protein n=1 Tax=Streptomyces sp. YIM 130001 TaxID=2259644 RepID=UPI000EB86C6E|nr:ABC transporter permease [Streptomyces sp. YIM 130001]RII19525.1 FtsX-like permease family protein [Streptomyces sp. YIM 130001]
MTGFGFIFLRARAHGLLLVAALLAVLLTTSVLATLAAFSGAIGDAALRHSLTTRSAAPASLQVSADVPPEALEKAERTVAQGASRTFDGLPVKVRTLQRSGPYALPRSAVRAPGSEPDLTHLAALDRSRIRLVSGELPQAGTDGPVQVALPEAAAAQLKLRPGGGTVTLTDRLDGPKLEVRVTGVYRPADPDDAYWQVDELGGRGVRRLDFTTYGPLLTDPAALASGRVSSDRTSWLATADFGALTTDRIDALREAAARGTARLGKDPALAGATAETALPDVLDRAERALSVSRSTLLIVALQLVLLAGYALLLVAGLLIRERGGETEVLLARGGSRRRIAALAAAESLLLALPAAAVAPLLAGPLTELLAGQGALDRIGLRIDTSLTWSVRLVGVLVALGCALAVAAPSLSAAGSPRRAVRAKSLPAPLRAGADAGLVVIAAVAYWQLDRQTSGAGGGEASSGVDPLLVAAPALALLAGTVLTLRLLPPAARLGERRAAKGRGLPAALAAWQLSRRPLRGAGPVLLLVLAVAMGMLAIGQGASWDRSQEDQADFRAGTEIRVLSSRAAQLEQGGIYGSADGVRSAAPGARSSMELSQNRSATVLALDTRGAAAGMLIRDDLASPGELAGALADKRSHSPGIALPEGTRRLEFDARTSVTGEGRSRTGDAALTASLEDRHGTTHQLRLGDLPVDGRTRTLSADIGTGDVPGRLRLTGIDLSVPLPRGPSEKHRLTVSGLRAATEPGGRAEDMAPPEDFAWKSKAVTSSNASGAAQRAAEDLRTATGSDRLAAVTYTTGSVRPEDPSWEVPRRQVHIGAEREKAERPAAVATTRFLESSGAKVGATVEVPLGSRTVPVEVVKGVDSLPTMAADSERDAGGDGGGLLLDLRSVNEALVAEGELGIAPTEWWLHTAPGDADRVAAELRERPDTDPEQVQVRSEIADELRDDPLGAGPQSALLAVAVAAAALAAVGFAVSAAGSLRERAQEFGVLRALGTPPGRLARLIAVEQGLLVSLALLVGVALGALLTRAVVPLIVLTPDAAQPVPSVLVELPVGRMVALLVGVAAVPLLIVAGLALRRGDPAVSLRHEGGR